MCNRYKREESGDFKWCPNNERKDSKGVSRKINLENNMMDKKVKGFL
jgi:hypothetical protein